MIATDTSTLIAYLSGDDGPDVQRLQAALDRGELGVPPPVVTELLSRPRAAAALDYILQTVPALEVGPGFWERAGSARQLILAQGRRAALADALIAQCCIDADVELITRGADFRHFARWCGLKLAK